MKIYTFQVTNHAGPNVAVVIASDMQDAFKQLREALGEDGILYNWTCVDVKPIEPGVIYLDYGWEG